MPDCTAGHVVMAAGKESNRNTRPTRAGFQMFWPSPPNDILPMPTATTPPMITIHSGRMLGRLKPRSRPVMSAEPLVRVQGRWKSQRSMAYSVARHAATLVSTTHSAGAPNVHTATAKVGIRAITTFHMQRSSVRPLCTCGDRDIVSSFISSCVS